MDPSRIASYVRSLFRNCSEDGTWLNNNCEKNVEGNVFDFPKTIIFIYSRNEILWKKGEF